MKRGPDSFARGEIETAAARWVARRDAGLSPADERELQRWIDADPRHRAALAFYDSAWAALAKPSHSGAGEDLEAQLTMLQGRRRRRRISVGGAAAVVVLSITAVMWDRSPTSIEPASPTAVVLVPPRQALPDGSFVELKGNARIAVEYTSALRRVVLVQGEAYFSVQEGPARPFVVSAGEVEVRAVGTAFSVQMSATAVEVLVTGGRVAVAKSPQIAPAAAAPASTILTTLDAGKRVVMDIAPSASIPEVSVVPATELDERLAWRSPRLEFTRTPLVEAVTLLNEHAPAPAPRLVIGDSVVGTIRVTGVFRAGNTDAFVLLLEGAFGVKAERLGNTIALRKAD